MIANNPILRLGTVALALLALSACDDSPTTPADPVPAEVEVNPDQVTLEAAGATEQLSALVVDADGVEIEDAEVSWSSSDAEVATVDADGLVEAVGEGSATITAESGEASGEAQVSVEPEENDDD